MKDKIKLDIVSDVVCPWCIIGYKHLSAAIESLGIENQINIEWQPFELNPDMPAEGENLVEHVARKYGASKADSERARAQITQAGADYGFTFNYFPEMKIVNTFDAHVLLTYAHSIGRQTELKMRLFEAFFSEQKDVSKPEVLIEAAIQVGIAEDEAAAAIKSKQLQTTVKLRESNWLSLGIDGVPTVIINGSQALTGAHPEHSFKAALKKVIAQANQ
ncbi:DsbA family oxidoreductase [Gayadomonas joobiniege]|uniref:DsbA family oxidoreductase n=1 Tax=Gayadomonas joobiniege TaxID=1234606 RepID=UPI0003695989|nr:DsbA family oxidoreductase [Gayadomonas joobiniege]